MIWLAWRQHRKQALFAVLGLAALAAFIVPTGLAMRGTFDRLGLDSCATTLLLGSNEACNTGFNRFNNEYAGLLPVGILFVVLPLLVGLFWGAPLVAREVEHGTHRLVWTQGISRRRWAVAKFVFVGLGALIASAVYGLGVSWWLSPLVHSGRQGRFDPFLFDMQGIAPIGYTLFAVALGIFAGTIWPKVLPAMAFTLVGFIGVRIAIAGWARSRYVPAETLTFPILGTGGEQEQAAGIWRLAGGIRDASGRLVASGVQIQCPLEATGPGARCGAEFGIGPDAYNWLLYQPADRYWLFQGIETGIFVAIAAVLLTVAVRRIKRIA